MLSLSAEVVGLLQEWYLRRPGVFLILSASLFASAALMLVSRRREAAIARKIEEIEDTAVSLGINVLLQIRCDWRVPLVAGRVTRLMPRKDLPYATLCLEAGETGIASVVRTVLDDQLIDNYAEGLKRVEYRVSVPTGGLPRGGRLSRIPRVDAITIAIPVDKGDVLSGVANVDVEASINVDHRLPFLLRSRDTLTIDLLEGGWVLRRLELEEPISLALPLDGCGYLRLGAAAEGNG